MGYEVYLTREGDGQGPGGAAAAPVHHVATSTRACSSRRRSTPTSTSRSTATARRVKSISGPETWYCGKHEEGAANERLATMVQQAMMDALHEYGYFPPDRGIKEDAADRTTPATSASSS